MPCRALGFGVVDDLRVLRGGHHHLAEGRFVTMHDHVDHVLLEHAEIGLAQDGGRGAKQDVGDVGGDEAAAPAVGQRGAHGMLQQVLVILVIADVGAVQRLDHFPVHPSGHDLVLLPQFLPFLRRSLQQHDLALLLPELGDVQVGQIVGDFFGRAPLDRDVVVSGHCAQLGHIPNHVALGLVIGHGLEREGHVAPVVGMGGRASGNGPDEVAGLDRVDGGAADAGLAVFGETARPHAAELAAHASPANVAG